MSNHIIETIGKWGVKTTPIEFRWDKPHAGDIVQFSEENRKYPVSCKYCRISSIHEELNRADIVNGMGSAFLCEDGSLSVAGGPFFGMPLVALEGMRTTQLSTFWNWGDNSAGAAQGVYYHIDRPLFLAKGTPNDYPVRYGINEEHARAGGEYKHGLVGPEFELLSRVGDTFQFSRIKDSEQ